MKRFTSIVLCSIISISSVSIYAYTDSSDILEIWYKKIFENATEKIGAVSFTGLIQLKEDISETRIFLSKETDKELGDFSKSMTEHSVFDIGNYQQYYLDVATRAEEELKKEKLTDLSEAEREKLHAELDAEIDQILAEALQ